MRLHLAGPILLSLALVGPAPAVASEATRTLRVELSGDPSRPFAVENLAGAMRVTDGAGDGVVAVATVHAESEELAQAMRFEQVTSDKGVPTLRVRYPVDRHTSYRYGRSSSRSGWSFWESLFGGFGGTGGIRYDGARVRVGGSGGVLLYADVEVQVTRRRLEATFRNVVGPLSGEGIQGRLRFDTGSGDVTVRDVEGEVVADTGSGNVKAAGVKGSFHCDTGSGNCEVDGFQGTRLSCDTGSGDVRVRGAEAEVVAADTGSGDVEVDVRGGRLSRVEADTGSGDVTLRLAPAAEFELRADTGSGDVVSRFPDAEPIRSGRKVVGYRRGDGRIRIAADTGSGDVVIEPVR